MRRFALVIVSVAVIAAPTVVCQQVSDSYGAQEPRLLQLEALLDGSGFAPISPGMFVMGPGTANPDQQPAHQVRISKGFEMGKFEVTQAQWNAVMAIAHTSGARKKDAEKDVKQDTNPSHFRGPARPVENVSWADVQEFLRKLNSRDSKHEYRLPTEAEWEYVARASSQEESTQNLGDMAWYESNSDAQTHPAGEKKANAWGIYDMQGNVAEWVQDWYGFDYYANSPVADPPGPASGSYRVHRGCEWFGPAATCRSSYQKFDFPNSGYYNVGFRLVRTAK